MEKKAAIDEVRKYQKNNLPCFIAKTPDERFFCGEGNYHSSLGPIAQFGVRHFEPNNYKYFTVKELEKILADI